MLLKLVSAAVVAALAALVVRGVKPELALYVQLAGIATIALLLLSTVQELLSAVDGMLAFAPALAGQANQGNGNSPFTMLVKALGVCVTSQIAADLCRDSGSTSLANLVELGGRLLVLALTLPLLKSVAELAVGLIRP